jgi:hypothetical protein
VVAAPPLREAIGCDFGGDSVSWERYCAIWDFAPVLSVGWLALLVFWMK